MGFKTIGSTFETIKVVDIIFIHAIMFTNSPVSFMAHPINKGAEDHEPKPVGIYVCPAWIITWGWKSPTGPDGGNG